MPGVGDPFHTVLRVPVGDGDLHVAVAGAHPAGAGAVVVAAHGITASHLAWRPPARTLAALRPDVCLLAPDLRGRGRSAAVGPPFGMARHAADLLAVLDAVGVPRAVVAGHSMGAFVAARLAADHPERVSAVVLVDGGLPIPAPPDMDPDRVLEEVLGPAIARLRMTFPSLGEYRSFWRAHPAFAGRWTPDVDAYVAADLTGPDGAMRSVVSEVAVRTDGGELIRDSAAVAAVTRVAAPLTLLRAQRGLRDDANPLIPQDVRDAFAAAHPGALVEDLVEVNHYTITLGAGADRVAAAIDAATRA